MIPELGHFALILALCLALALFLLPLVGVLGRNSLLQATSLPLAAGLMVFMTISFVALVLAFLGDDFSVAYIAANSNSALPWHYKVSAVWGAHKGSFLLWTLIMAGWTLAVARFSANLTDDMRARVMSILGFLATGFVAFLLFTSNPFERQLPFYPAEGADLNPLLQDFGLIVHPPLLYMGYVGFAVPFALAFATLWSGSLDAAWARWSRPWTNAAWAFLTVGITLGSWWAYYELGWGGWWFWDAVENASFMPWLVGTALVHSLAATEKRGLFKSWTVLLALAAFSLCLLGGFLVRSGVLTSVHTFAVDPARGLYILGFLVLVTGGSLLLYAFRASGIRSGAWFDWSSREALLLVNNLLLVVAAAAVLLGTLYPLLYEVVTDGKKISVGPPYFNAVFVPVAGLLFLVMIFSPWSRWKRTDKSRLLLWHLPAGVLALLVATTATLALDATFHPASFIMQVIALWMLLALLANWRSRGRKASLAYLGMLTAHAGIAIAVLGVAVTSYFSVGRDVRMSEGDRVELAGYEFQLLSLGKVRGPNFVSDQAEILVSHDGESVTRLFPEKRRYLASGSIMTEADMDPGFFRDLYVALGEPVGEGAWAVRVRVKPLVRWIWLGGLLIALGGFLAVMDRRYRRNFLFQPAMNKVHEQDAQGFPGNQAVQLPVPGQASSAAKLHGDAGAK